MIPVRYSKVNSGETGASNSDTSFDASAPEASADKGAGGLTPVELGGLREKPLMEPSSMSTETLKLFSGRKNPFSFWA